MIAALVRTDKNYSAEDPFRQWKISCGALLQISVVFSRGSNAEEMRWRVVVQAGFNGLAANPQRNRGEPVKIEASRHPESRLLASAGRACRGLVARRSARSLVRFHQRR